MAAIKSTTTHFNNITYMVGDKPLFAPSKGVPLNDNTPKDAWFIANVDTINEKAKSDGLWVKSVIRENNSQESATNADDLLGSLP